MEVQSSAFARSEVIYRPASDLTFKGVFNVSSANLISSTLPFQGNNVKFAPGKQPPSSDYGPLPQGPLNPTSTGATTVSSVPGTNVQATVKLLHIPIINAADPSIVTVNANGSETVDENSVTTRAGDLQKFTAKTATSTTVAANGTITVYTSSGALVASAKAAQSSGLDVTA